MASKKTECVKVAIRCRPFSKQEKLDNRQLVVSVQPSRGEIQVRNPKGDGGETDKTFTFDLAFDMNSTQEQIYQDTALPIVESVLEGYNGTVFA